MHNHLFCQLHASCCLLISKYCHIKAKLLSGTIDSKANMYKLFKKLSGHLSALRKLKAEWRKLPITVALLYGANSASSDIIILPQHGMIQQGQTGKYAKNGSKNNYATDGELSGTMRNMGLLLFTKTS